MADWKFVPSQPTKVELEGLLRQRFVGFLRVTRLQIVQSRVKLSETNELRQLLSFLLNYRQILLEKRRIGNNHYFEAGLSLQYVNCNKVEFKKELNSTEDSYS